MIPEKLKCDFVAAVGFEPRSAAPNPVQTGKDEYSVELPKEASLEQGAHAHSPWTGVTQFLPTTQQLIQFSSGKVPKVGGDCAECESLGLVQVYRIYQ